MSNSLPYKFIAADYDNTLVPIRGKASPVLVQVLKRYIDAGGYFTISTGRMSNGLISNMGDIPINAPLITYQGAKILNHVTHQQIKYYPIIGATAAPLLQELEERGLPVNVYHDDELYVYKEYPFLDAYCALNNIGYKLVPSLASYVAKNNIDCTKLLVLAPAELAKQLETEYSEKYRGILNVTRSAATFVEFNSVLATKGNAVAEVANMLGVKQSEVMCFGDSTNDSSMLQYAGLGVAVGNAMEELKAVADIVCRPCEQNGVAQLIEKLIFHR